MMIVNIVGEENNQPYYILHTVQRTHARFVAFQPMILLLALKVHFEFIQQVRPPWYMKTLHDNY